MECIESALELDKNNYQLDDAQSYSGTSFGGHGELREARQPLYSLENLPRGRLDEHTHNR